jgi:FlaG/FlaF family flagellin (archaellin)
MGDSQNWFEQGIALFENKNYTGAISAFDKAITFNQSPREAWFNRGLVYAQMGKYPKALQSFDQTLSLDPDDENAKKARTMVLALMEKSKNTPGSQDTVPLPQRSYDTTPASPAPVPSGRKQSIRNPFLAAIFSFLSPGWGQWYNGERWKGLAFFGVMIAGSILNLALTLLLNGNMLVYAVFMIAGFGILMYGMYDAYTTAEKINRGEIGFTRKSRLFWLPVILLVVMILVTIILAAVIASFVYGMAGNVQHTKVVAATVQQIDATRILVTYQGGQDANLVSQMIVMVTDSNGSMQTKTVGEPGRTNPLAIGSTATLTGTAGKDHVVATAKFTDGTYQVILDTYV